MSEEWTVEPLVLPDEDEAPNPLGVYVVKEVRDRLEKRDNEVEFCSDGRDAEYEAIDAENLAVAKLLQAAPALLHACELAYAELVKTTRRHRNGCECDCESLPIRCPVCACRAAIDKAKEAK